VYVWHNIEAHSRNHGCCGKAIFWLCLLVTQHVMRMRLIVMYPHYLVNGTVFGGGGVVIDHEMCVLISSKNFVWNFSHFEKNSSRYCYKRLHLKCRLFLSDIDVSWIFSTDFKKKLKYQISWKSSRSRDVPCGRTGIHSLRSSVCYFPQPPVTSFLVQMSPSALHPRSHPISVFSFSVREQVSHPYKTTGNFATVILFLISPHT